MIIEFGTYHVGHVTWDIMSIRRYNDRIFTKFAELFNFIWLSSDYWYYILKEELFIISHLINFDPHRCFNHHRRLSQGADEG